MKRTVSLLLTIIMLVSTVLSASSCTNILELALGEHEEQSNVDDTVSGGSSVKPDSSSGGGSTGESSGNTVYIPNDNDKTDYTNLKPESRALLSCVRIVSNFEKYIGYGQTSLSKYKKEGSGIIYKLDRTSGDAYIITNFHVVYHKDALSANCISADIDLYLYGQEHADYKIDATFVGGSLTNDIAILKVSGSDVIKHSHALAAIVTDSDKVRVGDKVLAVGNPEGYGISLTEGSINVDMENLSILGADGKTTLNLRVMRTSAAINEGNSGGGLFDDEGNLIGVVCAKRTGDDVDNFAYAIPINLAGGIADIIIDSKENLTGIGFYKYQLGINLEAVAMGVIVDEDTGDVIKVEKVAISSFVNNSPLAGEVAVGDVITAIIVDGYTIAVTRVHHVIDAMLSARNGSTVTLVLYRDGVGYSRNLTMTNDMLVAVP